jgi:hypothetical protein
MSDPQLDPLEEEALRRVRSNLLQAIRRHERAPARRRRTAMYAVGVGGAFAASVGAYVVLDHDPDESSVDTFYDSSTSTTRAPRPVAPPTSVVQATTSTVAPAERPTDFVGVTVDGRLVVVDAATGAEARELARRNDPRRPSGEGGPNVISGVAVDRIRRVVYYETCCEPAIGSVWSVPLDGGESTPVHYFSWPSLSADGTSMVGLAADRIVLTDLRGGASLNAPSRVALDSSVAIFHAALSADGGRIAYERTATDVDDTMTSEVVVVQASSLIAPDSDDNAQRAAMSDARVLRDPEGIGFMHPVVRRDGMVLVVQQCCYGTAPADVADGPRKARVVDPGTGELVGSFEYPGAVVDQQYDASGTWLIVTLADGRVIWLGGDGRGDLASGFTAAAW